MTAADTGEIEAVALEVGQAAVLDVQRQRDLDGALADAIEVVARQRARLKRRVCSRHDGETTRRVYELLRGMLESGADDDASFQ